MRRLFIIAALVVLLSLPAFCQRGGGHGAGGHAGFGMGGHGFAGGGRTGFAGHGRTMAMSARGRGFGSFRAGGIRFGGRPARAFSHGRFHDGFHDPFHHRFGGWGFPWWYYGYSVDPWLFDDFGNYSGYSDYQGSYNYPNGYDSQDNYSQSSYDQSSVILQNEIDRLNGEISSLREERELRSGQTSKQNAGSQSPKAEIRAETVLVFRDKHSEEVQNYAIVGKTLWIFDEQHAKKIPLVNLDIPATMKANEDRGVDFAVPSLNS